MECIWNLVHHENKLKLIWKYCYSQTNLKNDRILVLIGGLFVSNFALVDYSKLKFLHKVDIIT